MIEYLNIGHYVSVLLKEGTRWEFEKILTSGEKLTNRQIRRLSWCKRIVLFIPSCLCFYLLKNGLNENSIGYAISALSIFIGLFASLIITMYGRFLQMPKLDGTEIDAVRVENIKVTNFIKQFTFVTGKNLLIATTIIALMSLVLVFPTNLSNNIFDYTPVHSLTKLTWHNFLLFFNVILIIIIRGGILYLIFDFFILLLYSLGALFSFLKREYI
jgi:hypothetical protein